MTNPSLKKAKKGVVLPNDNKTKLSIFYGRCSTSKQKNSLETQMDMVSKYCDLNNIELDDIIIDDGVSGKHQKNRDGITKVMDLIKDNKVENLIVLSLSRFGRSFIENYKSVEIMKKHKTNFISLKENINLNDSMGIFIFNIFSSIYQLEIQNLSDRTSDTLQSKKRLSKVYCNTIYGFDKVGNQLEENPYEQKILRKIHSLKNKGYSYQKISDFLNRNNHKTKKGKKWNRNGVYFLLKTDRTNIGSSITNQL